VRILLEHGKRVYRLVMAIRPEALPSDTAALTEMVLALDAENEKLRVAMQTLKEMIFGRRSERLAALVADQLALELGDLETGVTPPVAANDDAPAAKPSSMAPRKKARRTSARCPNTCRAASRCWSRTRRPAGAAGAIFIRSARTSARCWT
jgi:Transposase C of IS166 homeodomain